MNKLDNLFTLDKKDFAKNYLEYLISLLKAVDLDSLELLINLILNARENNKYIFFIGNGGSAATASHFANDLSIGVKSEKKPIKAISLTDNIPIITAIGNDYGFSEIFSRQLSAVGSKGDLLIAISASGNSENLVKAFETANKMGIATFAITAFDGGILNKIANYNLHINTGLKEYGPAEDIHMIVDHLLNSYLSRYIALENIETQ